METPHLPLNKVAALESNRDIARVIKTANHHELKFISRNQDNIKYNQLVQIKTTKKPIRRIKREAI